MSINILGTLEIQDIQSLDILRVFPPKIEITHEHYREFFKIYRGGDWKNLRQLIEYCLYVGLAQLEKRMGENQKLNLEGMEQ